MIIMDLVAERGRVFNTKTRAPVMVCLETINFSEAEERLEELKEASKQMEWENQNRENQNNEIYDGVDSPQKNRLKEEIKINLEEHMKENTGLDNIDHDSIINNPFTGDEDNEGKTPSEEKDKKMKGYSSSYEPSSATQRKRDQFKKIGKFAKLIQIEEDQFKQTEDFASFSESSEFSDGDDSDESAFYDFESKRARKQRLRDLVPEEYKFLKRANSSQKTKKKKIYEPKQLRQGRKIVNRLSTLDSGRLKRFSSLEATPKSGSKSHVKKSADFGVLANEYDMMQDAKAEAPHQFPSQTPNELI